MKLITPVIVRRSVLGRIAAFILVVLIVSPFTAPFSAMSGSLEASPSGPADSVKSETTQPVDALVEATLVWVEPSWTVVTPRASTFAPIVEFVHVNRVLRL